MTKERFQSTGKTSFYSDYLYDRIVPQADFLRKLNEVVPWQRFTYKLVKYYRGKAREERPPYDPAMLLKMLLLAYLYNLSECDVERFCKRDLPAKHFLSLAIDAPVPDHSTLTVFKRRIVANGRLKAFEGILREIIQIAVESRVVFGSLQIIDSTHRAADVNVQKDDRRKKWASPLATPMRVRG